MTRLIKRLIAIALACICLDAQAAVSIFQYVEPSGEPPPPGPGFIAESAIIPTIESFSAATQTVTMALPGHPAPVNMSKLRAESRSNGFSWFGRIDNYATPSFITVVEGQVFGRLFTSIGQYEIRTSSSGVTLGTTDPSFRISDTVVSPGSRICCTSKETAGRYAGKATTTGEDPIRVLVGYTTAARIAAGGISQIRAHAQFAIDLNNQIFINSQVPEARLQLAGTMEVNHADPSLSAVFLDDVRLDPDIAAARNATYADLVAVLVEEFTDSTIAGIAYGNFTPSPSFESLGFSLSRRVFTGNFVFAHEIGHQQGMGHYNLSDPAAYAWGHPFVGFVDAPYTQGFLTVMNGDGIGVCGGSPPCFFVPYFSNASLTIADPPFQGRSLGVADTRENYRVARDTLAIVSRFRDDRLHSDGFE